MSSDPANSVAIGIMAQANTMNATLDEIEPVFRDAITSGDRIAFITMHRDVIRPMLENVFMYMRVQALMDEAELAIGSKPIAKGTKISKWVAGARGLDLDENGAVA